MVYHKISEGNMSDTMEILPGEGETQTVVKTRQRQECDVCGEPAHYKHTYLLDGHRRNPASRAYGKDDCSWCEDTSRFVCAEHKSDRSAPNGYSWCSTFAAVKRFAHMFLYWREVKAPHLKATEGVFKAMNIADDPVVPAAIKVTT